MSVVAAHFAATGSSGVFLAKLRHDFSNSTPVGPSAISKPIHAYPTSKHNSSQRLTPSDFGYFEPNLARDNVCSITPFLYVIRATPFARRVLRHRSELASSERPSAAVSRKLCDFRSLCPNPGAFSPGSKDLQVRRRSRRTDALAYAGPSSCVQAVYRLLSHSQAVRQL